MTIVKPDYVRWEHFAPGSFKWCVDHLDMGDPTVSQIVRVVLRRHTIWPEQLLGRTLARRYGAFSPSGYPISTGPCERPSIQCRFAFARRLCWRAIYLRTTWSVENIAEFFGYSPSTVRPWAQSWKPFEKSEGVWWMFWAPAILDDLGVEWPEHFADMIVERETEIGAAA